jgi:hypothetical protein
MKVNVDRGTLRTFLMSCGFAHARGFGPQALHPQMLIPNVSFVKRDKSMRDAGHCAGHPHA